MARKRASMREGPLAELFRATEAAQRQHGEKPEPEAASELAPGEPLEETVEHAPPFEPLPPEPVPEPEPESARPDLRPVEELPRVQAMPEPAPRLHRAPRLAHISRSSASSASAAPA